MWWCCCGGGGEGRLFSAADEDDADDVEPFVLPFPDGRRTARMEGENLNEQTLAGCNFYVLVRAWLVPAL